MNQRNIPNSSLQTISYLSYTMPLHKTLFSFLQAAIALYGIAYIFYHDFIISLLSIPFAFLYPKIKTRRFIENRKKRLTIQCKEMLYSLQTSMHAGKSPEAAFYTVPQDLRMYYQDDSVEILQEVNLILKKLEFSIPLEEALHDFSKRSGLEDIESFAESLRICKKHGGNLVEISKNTIYAITEKLEMEEDIEVILAQKKLEQKIMLALPLGMILLLSIVAKDYLSVMFEGLGHVIMTIILLIILLAYWLSRRLTRIHL